jgi:hypothetical protein
LTRITRVADEIGIRAVEVVAIDDSARRFYLKYRFTPLADDQRQSDLAPRTLAIQAREGKHAAA